MTVQPFRANIGSKIGGRNAAHAGMLQVTRNFKRFVEHLAEATPEVLKEALEPTFELSQVYCPKDTGAMADSGYLEVTTTRGKPMCEIGYGRGGVPPYTVAVHENMEWKHDDPTRSKWLQVALSEEAQEIQDRVKNGLKRAAGT